MDRRAFLLSSARVFSALALWSLPRCQGGGKKKISFPGSIVGPSYDLGHRLLKGQFPEPRQERKVPVVIVGGGITGLSAGWKLDRAGFQDFEILELEPEVGGVF